MNFGDRVKASIVNRAAEGLSVSVTVILIWVASKVGPAILPALEANLSKSLLVSLLLGALALNIVFVILFRILCKKPEFTLKYGVYWDATKNPHCSKCKSPIAGYDSYDSGGGYYCQTCKVVILLQDSSGNDVSPSQAVSEL